MTNHLNKQASQEHLLEKAMRAVEQTERLVRNLERFINECGPTLLMSQLALEKWAEDEVGTYRYIPLATLPQIYQQAKALGEICREIQDLEAESWLSADFETVIER